MVASGAIGSPKLLLMSGIGPADQLKSAGVNVVHDLPGVGKNLHDHPDITILYEVKGARTYDGQDAFLPSMKNGLEFLFFLGLVRCPDRPARRAPMCAAIPPWR